LSSWSRKTFSAFLKAGELPDGGSAGGAMVRAIKNTSLLSDEDRAAMAAYIKSLHAGMAERLLKRRIAEA
jgi:cytochrome c553